MTTLRVLKQSMQNCRVESISNAVDDRLNVSTKLSSD